MNKNFCDKCGSEISLPMTITISIGLLRKRRDIELCKKCHKELVRNIDIFMGSVNPEQATVYE